MTSNIHPYHHRQRVLLTILYISSILVLDLIWWKDNLFFSIKAYSAPRSGQIVVDPNNPAWFKYYQGGPFFMCGPGDPEGFLYRGTMNPDGTRKGDQLALIDKLKGTGTNSIYLMAVRSHGGDGDATQNPFINNDPAQWINQKVLDQWESWFTEMDKNKITIFFIFYDDGTGIWGLDDSGNLQTEETNFIQTLVDRFKHHKHLVWVVAEEYEEMDLGKPFANRNSRLHVSKIAEAIRMADTRGHPIAVHQQNGLTFAFPDDPNVDQFAVQYTADSPWQFHSAMVSAWGDAAGRYSLNLAEYHPIATGVTARKNSWAIAMGGAYVMHLGWDIENNTLSDFRGCGRLVSFMESTNFNEMSPHDELKYADTEYVLAVPGSSYIAYASSSSSGEIGLQDMTAGVYDFRWFSPKDGTTVIETDINVAAGTNSWPKPSKIGAEVAVYIKRTESISSPQPVVVFKDSFEVGEWNGLWTEDSQNDWFQSSQRAVDGSYSAEVDGIASNAKLISIPIDLQGRANATITFSWYIEQGFGDGEYIAFDVSADGGATWVQKARLRGNIDTEGVWHHRSFDLVGIDSLKIRFRGTASSINEDANVDMVQVIAW